MEKATARLSDPTRVPPATAVTRPAAAGVLLSQRPQVVAQREMADSLNLGPRMAAQRKQFQGLFGRTAQLVDRAEALPEQELLESRFAAVRKMASDDDTPTQFRNDTGLPDNLKSGVEALSGISLDNVRVHYNSSRPAQLNALAYAQGTDIHVAPGEEQHLPHEAWHVVQQAQGRVRATTQMKNGVAVNDDLSLELEADQMGARAARVGGQELPRQNSPAVQDVFDGPVQRLADSETLWDAYFTAYDAKMHRATIGRRDAQWTRWLQLFHNFEAALYAAKDAGGGAAYDANIVQDRYDVLMGIGLAVPAAQADPTAAAADQILQSATAGFNTFRGDVNANRGGWAGSAATGAQPADYVQTAAAVIENLRARQVAAGGRLGNWWLMASDTAPSGWALHRGAVDARGDFIYHL